MASATFNLIEENHVIATLFKVMSSRGLMQLLESKQLHYVPMVYYHGFSVNTP